MRSILVKLQMEKVSTQTPTLTRDAMKLDIFWSKRLFLLYMRVHPS